MEQALAGFKMTKLHFPPAARALCRQSNREWCVYLGLSTFELIVMEVREQEVVIGSMRGYKSIAGSNKLASRWSALRDAASRFGER